jgi:hypothetical protein
MNAKLSLGCAIGMCFISGCAATNLAQGRAPAGEGLDAAGAALQAPSVRVGAPRVLDERVNPLAPLRLTLRDGAIAVSFEHAGRRASREIDPGSLEPRSQSDEPSRGEEPMSTSVQRIVLDGGRFIVCWTSGNLEWGHRAMAQMFNASDGSPRGGPVPISPTNADVIGSPRAITSDGNRVVAMFSAMSGSSVVLMAVPIEDAAPSDAERSARR